MIGWIANHELQAMMVGYLMFSTLVGAMPELPPEAGWWAQFGYRFVHGLAMNWRKAFEGGKLVVESGREKTSVKEEQPG
jgi:hypothetical protein